MPKKSSKTTPEKQDKPQTPEAPSLVVKIIREGILIGLIALCAYLALSLFSYSPNDPGWSKTGTGGPIENAGGPTGAWFADVFFSIFGSLAFLFPVMLAYQVWLQLRDKTGSLVDPLILALKTIGFVLVMVSGCAIAVMQYGITSESLPFSTGGYLGLTTASAIDASFGYIGGSLLLVAMLLFGLTIFINISWFAVMDAIGAWVLRLVDHVKRKFIQWRADSKEKKVIKQAVQERREAVKVEVKRQETRVPPTIQPVKKKPVVSERVQKEKQHTLFSNTPVEGELPAVGLLDPADKRSDKGFSEESLEAMSRVLELKLKDFGVVAEVVAVLPGPVVTRFEIQPAAGVKVSKITNLAKDLARSMAVSSVRVVEIIQGKSVVGIEIPNEHREMVRLGEVISSELYEKSKSPLTLALGHDISGQPVTADLAKMPHLLVAGTTGSGKSVGVNSMLVSILYKSTPEEVRMILVDPKMLELSVYDGIPHLLTPVITDMKDAATGLRWCVGEMERRYKLMAAMGVRNLAGFNKKIRDAKKAGEPLLDPLWKPEDDGVIEMSNATAPELGTLPFIVVVIDEFADMMMIVGKKVEQLIARIAQKARAAGIHLVLATQRPSVDVITGLIKANVPTRMAFQVSSKIDSRTILDQGGAEQLLGHGDMLYLAPGTAVTTRVHGAFIDDHEVHKVVADWKQRGEPDYLEEIFSESVQSIAVPGFSNEGEEDGDSESDPLYDEAVAFVTETRKASISSVQRKLRIGYNRAARLIEQMEATGVVTPMASNGNREVLAPAPPR